MLTLAACGSETTANTRAGVAIINPTPNTDTITTYTCTDNIGGTAIDYVVTVAPAKTTTYVAAWGTCAFATTTNYASNDPSSQAASFSADNARANLTLNTDTLTATIDCFSPCGPCTATQTSTVVSNDSFKLDCTKTTQVE